jgi:hypothetical protein
MIITLRNTTSTFTYQYARFHVNMYIILRVFNIHRSDSLLGWYTTEMKILAIRDILLGSLLTIIF